MLCLVNSGVMKVLSILLISMLLSSCAAGVYTQTGVDLSRGEGFSVITTESENEHGFLAGLDRIVIFTSLDDVSLHNIAFKHGGPQKLNLAPGLHKVEVRFNHLGMIAGGCMQFIAETGGQYKVRNQAKDYSVRFWIESETHEVVGNICGFESS